MASGTVYSKVPWMDEEIDNDMITCSYCNRVFKRGDSMLKLKAGGQAHIYCHLKYQAELDRREAILEEIADD